MLWLFCHFIQTTFHKKSVFSPKKRVYLGPESLRFDNPKKRLVLRPKISEKGIFSILENADTFYHTH